MAHDINLASRVRQCLHREGVAVEEMKMMGGLCFIVDGKMCLGVESRRLMVRLDPGVYESALQRPGCTPMDFTGRPMKGFVWVNLDAGSTDRALHDWAALALEFNPRVKASRPSKSVRKSKHP